VKELVSENTKHQADLEYEKGERELLARELEEKAERMNALDSESKALKEQVATLDAELGTSKAHAAIMEENFLAARQEAADASAKADQLSMTLKELEGKPCIVRFPILSHVFWGRRPAVDSVC
jgi:chromosome segregation ATPase